MVWRQMPQVSFASLGISSQSAWLCGWLWCYQDIRWTRNEGQILPSQLLGARLCLDQKARLPAGREGARQDVCVPTEGPAGLTRRKSQALQVSFILWFFFSKQHFWPQSELRLQFALLNFTNPAPRQTTFKSWASSARAANLRPARHPSCATCKAQAFSERPWESRGSTAGRPEGRVTCIYFGSPRGQLP